MEAVAGYELDKKKSDEGGGLTPQRLRTTNNKEARIKQGQTDGK